MTLYRMVDGVQVQLTDAEALAQHAEWDANIAAATAWATNYINLRTQAITALGPLAVYEAINGAGAYTTAVANIIAKYPAP